MKTIIIAEAGVNHNGSLKLALKLVDYAAKAKADFGSRADRNGSPCDLEAGRHILLV